MTERMNNTASKSHQMKLGASSIKRPARLFALLAGIVLHLVLSKAFGAEFKMLNGRMASSSADARRMIFYNSAESASRRNYTWDGEHVDFVSELDQFKLISADGNVVLGQAIGGPPKRGTSDGTLLDTLTFQAGLNPQVISANGDTIAGTFFDSTSQKQGIFRWNAITGPEIYDTESNTGPIAASSDGSVLVFMESMLDTGKQRMKRWILGGAVEDLECPLDYISTLLFSDGGTKIVCSGLVDPLLGPEIFYQCDLAATPQWLPVPEMENGWVTFGCITPDGKAVFGRAETSDGKNLLVRLENGIYNIESDRGFFPTHCTPDGKVVAGKSIANAAFMIWHAGFGARSLREIMLGDYGQELAEHWLDPYDDILGISGRGPRGKILALSMDDQGIRLAGSSVTLGLSKGWLAVLPVAAEIESDPFVGAGMLAKGKRAPNLLLTESEDIENGPDGNGDNTSLHKSRMVLEIPLADGELGELATDTKVQLFLNDFSFCTILGEALGYTPDAARAVWTIPSGQVSAKWTARKLVINVSTHEKTTGAVRPPADTKFFAGVPSTNYHTYTKKLETIVGQEPAELSLRFGYLKGRRLVRFNYSQKDTSKSNGPTEQVTSFSAVRKSAAFSNHAPALAITSSRPPRVMHTAPFRLAYRYPGLEYNTVFCSRNGEPYQAIETRQFTNLGDRSERAGANKLTGNLEPGTNVVTLRLVDAYGNTSTTSSRYNFVP